MKTITVGATGEKVSALCLGTMERGTKVDERGSMRLLDRYCEAGGRFIDTTNNYGRWSGGTGWESEIVIGRWMRERRNRGDPLAAAARETGATPVQVALAWMLRTSPQVLPLVSASTPEQLDEDLGALRVRLEDKQVERLSESSGDNLTQ